MASTALLPAASRPKEPNIGRDDPNRHFHAFQPPVLAHIVQTIWVMNKIKRNQGIMYPIVRRRAYLSRMGASHSLA